MSRLLPFSTSQLIRFTFKGFSFSQTSVLLLRKLDVLLNRKCKIAQVPACQIGNNLLVFVPAQNTKCDSIAKDVLLWNSRKSADCSDIPQHKKCLFVQSYSLSVNISVPSWMEYWMKFLDVQICALDAGFHRTSESQLLTWQYEQIFTFSKSSKYPHSIDSWNVSLLHLLNSENYHTFLNSS